MSTSFYRAFEDRHRGSRELIKARLAVYHPFLAPLSSALQPAAALDLGCGRGEWLELLGESGFAASGIDLDEGMLAACRERGLDVSTTDALAGLRAQPDASLALVTAFHLIEHIAFDVVQELIGEALRALQPGGLLIMETPNPENLIVATCSFYMDPSHLRPIPPQLLDFVVEHAGFHRHKIVRLQEPTQLHGAATIELINVLDGVSPDYSVVAQKSADQATLDGFDAAFAADYGIELSTLAQRYQSQQAAQHTELHSGLHRLGGRVTIAESALHTNLHRLHERVTLAESAMQAELHRLDERVISAELTAAGLLQSALPVITEAQATTRLAQAELHDVQQHERALEASVQAHALRECEARAALYLSQAQDALARAERAEALHLSQAQQALAAADLAEQQLSVAEQRVLEAEQRVPEARQQQAEHDRIAAETRERHISWQLDVMTARALAAEQKVAELYASHSWQMTRPARAALNLLRRPSGAGDIARLIAARQKLSARTILLPLVRNLAARPRARAVAMRVLARFPALEGRLRALAYRAMQSDAPPAPAPASDTASIMSAVNLPPRAARLYAELQIAVAKREH